ncbi:MAG: hypothetical protein Q7O12_14265 [Deltaproteobacteria bacterium]|nr:hypothetical protein [Deltaproteobacteria bacterium]
MTTTFNPELMENRFKDWYADLAKGLGLSPDPDAPGNNYNYRAAWLYGLNTDTPIPGPNLQFPATFQGNMPPVSPDKMMGLPEIIAQGQGQQTTPGAQPWKLNLGPSQAWADPPPAQVSQVADPPVSTPGSQPLTIGGKPVIGPPGGKWVLDEPAGGKFIDVEIPDKNMTGQMDPFKDLDAQLGAVLGVPPEAVSPGMVEMSPEGQKSTRYNNPYNVKYPSKSDWVKDFGGTLAPDGKFTQFATPEQGVAAATHLIQRDYAHLTVSQAINKFAPISENPGTPQRIKETAAMLGVSPETPLTQIPLAMFMQSQVRYESPTKINPAVWGEAGNQPIQSLGRQATAKAYQTQQVDPFADLDAQLGKVMAQPQVGAPAAPPQTTPPPAPSMEDPMAASVGMFNPVAGAKELGKQVAEHGQAVGTLATAATKLPGVVAAPITGMAVAAGGLLNRAYTGKDSPITPEEQTLMDQGLPFATGDMARDFLTGVGAEFGGRGIAWGAGKLLAPAAGKITDAGRSFMEFAKKNNLPYSPDAVAPIWRSKLAQGLADTGVGKYFTTRQRGELVQGASEAAGKVLDDLGLPAPLAPTEAAGDLAGYLRQLSNKKLTHAQFNEAMGRIPAETEMAVPNLMQALDDIGGLNAIHGMYAGKSGSAPREFGLLKRVINRDGVITKDELDFFNKTIWRKWADMDPEARAAAGKLKEGVLKDLDTILDPELGQTLGAIRTAADDAYKQAETFLQNTPLAGDLMKAGRPQAKARQFFNLFSEGHRQDALAIRDHLLSTGNKDLWDTTKASYLEGVFKRATKLSEDTGETVFQPGAYINWFDKYGKGAGEIMPEHAPALQEWYNVSKGLLKDYKRYGERGREILPTFKLGALSGGGYLAGGVEGVVVANGFALLSALGTMGKGNLGFLRNYLLRESAPFGVPFLKGAAEFGGVEGYQHSNTPQPAGGKWVLDEGQ